MDARIGILIRDGKKVHYAHPNGHRKPAVEGSRAKVEAALGLRPRVKKTAPYRDYIVTLEWKGGEPEELPVQARNAADAIKQGREFKNNVYGRTLQCNTLPCTFRARRAKD